MKTNRPCLLEIKGFRVIKRQPTKGRQTENERMQIEKYKLTRGVEAKKKRKRSGCKTMAWRI